MAKRTPQNRTAKANKSKQQLLDNVASDLDLDQLLSEMSLEDEEGSFDKVTQKLGPQLILSTLKKEAEKGNIRALELLGKHFQLFEKNTGKSEDQLLEIFAEEGTIDDNIFRFLDILEDKYQDEMVDSLGILLEGQHKDDLYKSELEKNKLRKQIQDQVDKPETQEENTLSYKEELGPPDASELEPAPTSNFMKTVLRPKKT